MGGGCEPAPLLHPGGNSIAFEVSTMIGFNNDAGGAGGFSFDDSHPSHSSNRGRTRSDDFGLPGRPELDRKSVV